MQEIWKVRPVYADYALSDQGRIKRVTASTNVHGTRAKVDNILKPYESTKGYLRIFVCKGDKKFNRMVHRLVVETFIGPISKSKEVNHKNGIKSDSRLDNLEITTRSANMKHAYANGLQKPVSGEKHGECKLTSSQVEEIRKLYAEGNMSQYDLADQFETSQGHVSNIIHLNTRKRD